MARWRFEVSHFNSLSQDVIQRDRRTPERQADLQSVTLFIKAEHQLLPCLFLILRSTLRRSCLVTLVSSDHMSSPIYKPSIYPAATIILYYTFSAKLSRHQPPKCPKLLRILSLFRWTAERVLAQTVWQLASSCKQGLITESKKSRLRLGLNSALTFTAFYLL